MMDSSNMYENAGYKAEQATNKVKFPRGQAERNFGYSIVNAL